MLLSIVYCGLNHHTHPKLLWGFPTESYYITLIAFELNGRGGDGVGKAGDGHQSTRPRYLGDVVIQAEACEQNGQHHQRHGGRHGAVLFGEAQSLVAVDKALTQDADQSPDPEGVEAIPKNGRFGAL